MSSTRTFRLSNFTGRRARCSDPRQNAVLLENSTISCGVYRPGTVDAVMFDHAVILEPATADYLYSDFTPVPQPYEPGTRVFLEKIVDRVTDGIRADGDRAIALMDWVRDLPRTYTRGSWLTSGAGGGDLFHGGTEEEVIRKGSDMCNEMARVLGILAQVAGMPSRYVGHMVAIDYDDVTASTGHGVSEIYIDGQWAYFDVRGRYFIKDDGSFASAWDLLNDPDLIHRQGKRVLSHRCRHTNHALAEQYYVSPAVTIVANYLASDHRKYDYSWVYPSESRSREARELGRHLRVTRHQIVLPQPRVRIG